MKRSFIIPTLLTLLLPVQIINADVQSQNSVLRQHSIEIEGLINNDIRKADSLVKAGKPDEALTYYKSSLKSKDSLYNLITNSQMEEILSLYNMDKLILQREQRRSMFHQACLYISVIIILALLLTNIHIYRSRKRLQKNEKEIRRLTSIAEEANEIKSHFLTNMSYNIRIPLNNVVGFSQLMTEKTQKGWQVSHQDPRKSAAKIIEPWTLAKEEKTLVLCQMLGCPTTKSPFRNSARHLPSSFFANSHRESGS